MKQLIIRLGRGKSVVATTAITTFLSNLFTLLLYIVFRNFGIHLIIQATVTIATVVPLLITPFVAWYLFGLVIEINNLEEEMRELATSDALTGLLTRRFFFEEARMLFHIAMREKFSLSAMILDFDGFKGINDAHGHDAGDKVLRAFGDVVRKNSRKSDICGRLGGEEFAFILSHTTAKQALNYANRFQEAIQNTVITDCEGNEFSFTVSIGIVNFPDLQTENVETLLTLADKALYMAKEQGKNCSVVYREKD